MKKSEKFKELEEARKNSDFNKEKLLIQKILMNIKEK